MDVFDYACPQCGKNGKAPGHLLGKELQCEECGKGFFASGVVKPVGGGATRIALLLAVVGLTSAFAGAAMTSMIAGPGAIEAREQQQHQAAKIEALQAQLAKEKAERAACPTCGS